MRKNFTYLILLLAAASAILLFFTGCGTNSGTVVTYNDIVWAVGANIYGSGTILKTVNSGITWTRQGSPEIPDIIMNDVIALNSTTAWVVGGNIYGSATIFLTTDGGDTWTRQGSGEVPDVYLYAITAASTLTAWAVGDNGTIVKTTNGGASWATQESGTTAQLEGIKAVDENIAWAGGNPDNGYVIILRTIDGGANWSRVGISEEVGGNPLIKITAFDADTAWAVGGCRTAIRTDNGGASWEQQFDSHPTSNGDLNNIIAFDTDRAWMAADAGVMLYTSDGGATWEGQTAGTSGYYLLGVDAVDQNNIWSVGSEISPPFNGIIVHTFSGGAPWSQQLIWDKGLSAVSAVGGNR
ncbi:WD40/YVTN/BNR-like repeat-containing protein [Candidatus Margulisiibacteriota bacterium]